MNPVKSAEILTVGTEILMGQIINTNASYLAKQIAQLGITSQYQTVVGDNPLRLQEAIETALSRSDCVIMTGGLGPTADDISMEIAAKVAGVNLVRDQASEEKLIAYFTGLGRTVSENNFKQILFPEGSTVIPNNNGTAPGAIVPLEFAGKTRYIILLPGPPSENTLMFQDTVRPFFESHSATRLNTTFVRMIGIGESDAEYRMRDVIEAQQNPTLAPYASEGEVTFRITQLVTGPDEPDLRAPLLEVLQERLGQYIYEVGTRTMPEVVKDLLVRQKKTVAFAESCTAGQIAATFADIPGISEVMLGGIVSYDNCLKESLLKVPKSTLETFGAVSSRTAEAMALGCLEVTGADVAVAVTGIAGPDGGTAEKPVGTVFISVADRQNGLRTRKHHFRGNRAKVRKIATLNAFNLLRLHLLDERTDGST